MKKIKAYCEKNNIDYKLVEKEWLAARMEAKK